MCAKNKHLTLGQIKKRIKQASFDEGFITPVIENVAITEANSDSKLKQVTITNIPHSGNDYDPIAWLMNLEMKHPLFAPPQYSKTCENALILLLNRAINVFVFELKSSIQDEGGSRMKAIQEKIVNSVDRIAYILPLYIPNVDFDDVRVNFWGVVCYNQDKLTKIADKEEERKTELYKILKDKIPPTGRIRIDNILAQRSRMEIFFFKNPSSNSSSMALDFKNFYAKNIVNKDLRFP